MFRSVLVIVMLLCYSSFFDLICDTSISEEPYLNENYLPFE
jgi:hypothetical protein